MEKSVTNETLPIIGQRFRGFLPVVVDVETAGFNAQTDALLEIAAIPIIYNEEGQFVPGPAHHAHINPQFRLFIMKKVNLYRVLHIMRISTPLKVQI